MKQPDLSEIRKNIYIINTSKELLDKQLNRITLTEKDIVIIYNSGSGNCFFNCINQFYINKESYHYFIEKKYVF